MLREYLTLAYISEDLLMLVVTPTPTSYQVFDRPLFNDAPSTAVLPGFRKSCSTSAVKYGVAVPVFVSLVRFALKIRKPARPRNALLDVPDTGEMPSSKPFRCRYWYINWACGSIAIVVDPIRNGLPTSPDRPVPTPFCEAPPPYTSPNLLR